MPARDDRDGILHELAAAADGSVGVGDPVDAPARDPATAPRRRHRVDHRNAARRCGRSAAPARSPQGDAGPVAAISTHVAHPVRADRRRDRRGRDAAHRSELAKRARERGIGIAGSGGTGATHMLKGYFSAMTDGGSTTVIYVWDVLDPAGNRLHRIQGQAQGADGSGDGWSAVPPATMQAIADRTIDEFAHVAVDAHGLMPLLRLTDSLDYRGDCDDSACNSRAGR